MERCLAFLLLLCTLGCYRSPAPNLVQQSYTDRENAQIIMKSICRNFSYEDEIVLKVNIQYPEIHLQNGQAQPINSHIQSEMDVFYFNAITSYYWQAMGEYLHSKKSGSFLPREATLQYTITLSDEHWLSLYRDEYLYLGGAHGITIRHSDTYDLHSGNLMTLNSFFQKSEEYRNRIIRQITEQADIHMQQDALYYDDYRVLIHKCFHEKSFYLTAKGIVFYFQEYEIAPYAAGIVEFTLPYVR